MAQWRWPGHQADRLEVLPVRPGDRGAALDLCRLDPVGAVLAGPFVEGFGRAGLANQLLGVYEHDELRAFAWSGANLVPVAADARSVAALADVLRRRGRRCSSIVGPREMVLGLWERLEPSWSEPREVRPDQPSLVIGSQPSTAADPLVRRSTRADFPLLFPAAVAMFTEEVGYSPTVAGSAYEQRVRELVDLGRSFVRIDEGPDGPRVVFKAELGAVALGVAQIQGVWVPPDLRGRGLATAGVAAVVQSALADIAPTVSLYVNSYNTPALAVYRRVGFRQVGTYATVLF